MLQFPHKSKTKQAIIYTLQCLLAIFIALSIKREPYGTHIILTLTALITIKHGLVEKIVAAYEKIIANIKRTN